MPLTELLSYLSELSSPAPVPRPVHGLREPAPVGPRLEVATSGPDPKAARARKGARPKKYRVTKVLPGMTECQQTLKISLRYCFRLLRAFARWHIQIESCCVKTDSISTRVRNAITYNRTLEFADCEFVRGGTFQLSNFFAQTIGLCDCDTPFSRRFLQDLRGVAE